MLTAFSLSACAAAPRLIWDQLPATPPSPGQASQPGLASPFAGVDNDALLVGGGANFPGKMPWDGGTKIWWDDLFVLEKKPGATPAWVTDKAFKLPRKIAYGVSFTTSDGVVCAGGSDASQCVAEVFLLRWNPRSRLVETTLLPSMPQPLAFMSGAVIDHVIYVVGGQHTPQDSTGTSTFWSLDLTQRGTPDKFKWKILPDLPGAARVLPVVAAQTNASGPQIYVFSGRSNPPSQASRVFDDAFRFDLKSGRWHPVKFGAKVMAGAAAAGGPNEVLIFSGDAGALYLKLETHDLAVAALRERIARAPTESKSEMEAEIAQHLAAKKKIYLNHPGFSRDVIAFDTLKETWQVIGQSPTPGQVTTVAVPWDGAIVLVGGEIRPAIRTPSNTRVTIVGR